LLSTVFAGVTSGSGFKIMLLVLAFFVTVAAAKSE
jgi:hypothetical protein